MTDYDIGLAIPKTGRGRKRDPNSRMSIIRGLPENGSWFFTGIKNQDILTTAKMLRNRGEITFRVRTRRTTENGVDGVRVWRLHDDASE